jgi:uncharacterized membrane protein (DUF485 family)
MFLVTVTWYPKNIVIGIVLLAALAIALNVAVDVTRGVLVGAGAIVVCAIVDALFTFNPAILQRRQRPTPHQ